MSAVADFDTRLRTLERAAEQRLRDAVQALQLKPHAGIAILAAAQQVAKARARRICSERGGS